MFKEAVLNSATFCVTWEQILGRGANEKQQDEIIINAEKARKSGRIHALGITDNPGGNPSLSVELVCAELKHLGMEPVVHFACRDKNRNTIESMLYGLERCQAHNLLILSGDYPSPEGFGGTSRPVFDLDPVHVLQLVGVMNRGMEYQYLGKNHRLLPTSFFAGIAVTPFKKTEAELSGQYFKLRKKIAAGAHFAIMQIGYDARKIHELLLWLKTEGLELPVLANLFMLTSPAAKFMNAGKIPGCVVPDKIVAKLAEEQKAPDKGLNARIMRMAGLYAVARGVGCAGVHIGGHNLKCETVLEILDRGEELAPNWRDLIAELDHTRQNVFYYYFQHDEDTGLNKPLPAPRPQQPSRPLSYRFAGLIHQLVFTKTGPLFPVCRAIAGKIDARPRGKNFFGHMEHIIKVALFRCIDCGDCALHEVAYLCPMSQCPKSQRNGPCGGSDNGWCEVYPNEKKCIWVRAYERLKDGSDKVFIGAPTIPPCNWELWQTSSWLNFFLGRDHTAKMEKQNSTSQKQIEK